MKKILLLLFLVSTISLAQKKSRWQIEDDNAISWTIHNSQLPHSDNIEMSGRKVSGIIHYEVDTLGILSLEREIIYPQKHPLIKETDPWWSIYRAYGRETYTDNVLPKLYIKDKEFVAGKLKKVTINGIITFDHEPSLSGITLSRKLYPSTEKSLFIEEMTLTNTTDSIVRVSVMSYAEGKQSIGKTGRFVMGVASLEHDGRQYEIAPKKSKTIYIRYFSGNHSDNSSTNYLIEPLNDEYSKREEFLKKMRSNLILETPSPVLNQLFEFSKIRASESIFDSKLGPIHSPGGGRYYVGTWANDQAEYVSPLFPYLGYSLGNESAMNTYRAFDSVKPPDYGAIQYAFEVEELAPPSKLDRGDAAMIAYGASQYALARGDAKEAQELWPLIAWSLEYNHRNLNPEGVVQSQSDEMEGRIETGDANLSTSSLYYGALTSARYLAKSLGKSKKQIRTYEKQQIALGKAIESYFGATIDGLETYKYFEEHQSLRHWICLPLVMDIDNRKEGTIQALFNRLWGDNGVLVEKDHPNPEMSKTFWDRGTLYALRGTLRSGATNRSIQRLEEFSETRLLGERVPYVVEAYPEGSMAHLSAESGLYCRVFTEGLFAITPSSFNSFTMQPRLPDGWKEMALRRIQLFGENFDIEVQAKPNGTQIKVIESATGKVLKSAISNLKQPLSFTFNKVK